ncbi:hypothetical protein J5J86_23805 [Aquabacter sp. L1I39]|uniref:hypothetical protein n=1 Tax=Aquabacter sp. L1I39 TaxID=2820278 RepID=UPI001AD9F18A|nr:hypothetical protein [Aquabacter sp. L1I39]QTL03712.1 hypothetical protein J5J86_23805 [Aquabacter sp. L1I39]
MSEFREYGMLQVGTSAADPDALARVVRNHKAGDAMTQAAITVALMVAICAVTFVLTVDRAAAATLLLDSSGSPSFAFGLAIGAGLAALGIAIVLGHRLQERRTARLRPVPVPVRARRPS